MKRPEGFDKPVADSSPPSGKTRRKRGVADTATSASPRKNTGKEPKTSSAIPRTQRPSAGAEAKPDASPELSAKKPAVTRTDPAPFVKRAEREAPAPAAINVKKQLRHAARARKRAERAELRRFTRRARTRKFVLLSVAGVVVALIALITVAVFSPILALRTVVVDGANRIDPAEIQAAVETQQGTPLALLDFDAITEQLSVFPLIRSYVTEIVPPDTLLVHIVEREPIGSVQSDGVFRLVDPAGVTIQESAERIPGVPVIDVGAAGTEGAGFATVTEVLLSLPPALQAQVESVTATTKDDVSFVLSGVGQRVVWGSASDSARKAVLLEYLISITEAGKAGEFDVSAPSNGIFRPS